MPEGRAKTKRRSVADVGKELVKKMLPRSAFNLAKHGRFGMRGEGAGFVTN
jgi:hypothetical protein